MVEFQKLFREAVGLHGSLGVGVCVLADVGGGVGWHVRGQVPPGVDGSDGWVQVREKVLCAK